MVNVSLTVREIVSIMQSTGRDFDDLYDKLLKALEDAIVSVPPAECSLPPIDSLSRCGELILSSIPTGQFINAIRIIRNNLGTRLYEAKKFCDVVRGKFELRGRTGYGGEYRDGKPNSISIENVRLGCRVAMELRDIGCDAHYV
jgi:hypothetical protein